MYYPFVLPMPKPRDDLVSVVSSIADNDLLAQRATEYKLTINRVTWEDTSRNKNSAYGGNITDQCLRVTRAEGVTRGEDMTGAEGLRMPIIRRSNFPDFSCDLDIRKFSVMTGNERGTELKERPLSEYLQNIRNYVDNPLIGSMYADRDTRLLTSSQFCVLPLREGKVNFGIQLHNYQSSMDNPAILTIVASKEGTSAQAITKYNQVLYFNKNGKAHDFSATRLSEDRKSRGVSTTGSMTQQEQEKNCLIVLHVPLIAKPLPTRVYSYAKMSKASASMASMAMAESKEPLGMEDAIVSVGNEQGDFTGMKDSKGNYFKLERDTTKPIRVVLQFYLTTDTDDIKSSAFKYMSEKISQVCANGENAGSLVVDGPTTRPTETTTTTGPMFSGFSQGGNIMPKGYY